MSNDMMIALVAVGVLLLATIAFVVSALRTYVHASLSHANVGDVFDFDYEQPLHGQPKRVLAQVIEPVATLDDYAIRNLNARSRYRRYDPLFHRTNHLVTCKMPNGDIRQFYAERATNVRRSLFGKNMFKIAALFV